MKKLVVALLIMTLLMGFSCGVADGNWGTKTLNEAETAGYALAMFLGDPSVITVNKGDSFDDINARYIFIGYEALGCDLGVAIRVSDTQMYFWSLALTPDNLIKAKLVLDEDAPVCSVMYYEGNELKDSATYYKSFSTILPYADFKSEVERITTSLSSGDMSASAGTDDPILACFPGLSWGMTKDDMLNKVGKDLFTEINSEAGTSLFASPEIYGEAVMVLFVFGDDNKVNMFSAMISKEKSDQYLTVLTEAYGTPHQTTLMGALNGKLMAITDDPSGDCYAWKTDKSLIILDGSSVQYWSLY